MPHDFEALTERDIAKTIDHSLLRPELDDASSRCSAGAQVRRRERVRPPADVRRAKQISREATWRRTTIGFPHGNHRTDPKSSRQGARSEDGATTHM